MYINTMDSGLAATKTGSNTMMNTVTFDYGNKQITISTGDAKDWKGVRKYFDLEVQGKANPLRTLYEIIDGTTRDKTVTFAGRTFGYEYGFADSKTKRNAVDQAVACLVEQIVAA
jgi:hypothetical protein